jgi:multidrug efflux pump subunit AcrA (membrane-fusion protein)
MVAVLPHRLVKSSLIIAFFSLAAAGCDRSEGAQASTREAEPKPVRVESVRRESIPRSVDVVGTLSAVDQVTISAETEGTVKRLFVDLGDPVSAGAVVVQLDSEKQQYAYEQQEAALARTLAQYGAIDAQHLPELEKTPDAQRANADLVQATQAFDRANELFGRALISQQALDDARATLQSKRASYNGALQSARNLRASIQAAEAAMKMAARQLRDTEIRAPFDGFVEKRLVNAGELVKATTPVVTIVRLDPLKVTAEIPEKMVPWINTGQLVEVQVDAYPGRRFAGKVSRLSPAVNASTRAFPFEAVVANADTALKPGTFARVHIESGKVDEVMTVPYAALQYRYGVNRAFVLEGDKLSMRELTVGERLGERIEVLTGLSAGDRVAVSDVDSLADGALVMVEK